MKPKEKAKLAEIVFCLTIAWTIVIICGTILIKASNLY